jgi:octaprenyl-diphosphate synthase
MLEDIGKHSLLGEGKRLRPLLFVLSSGLCGYKGKDVYSLSTIFEYIHSASLLHDDVIDNAAVRRNKPSASSLWGNSAAVLTGDIFSVKAMKIAINTNNMDFFQALINAGARMSEGQFMEQVHTGKWDTTKEEYMEIITSKTAELMSAACVCGAIMAGAGKDTEAIMSNFGLNMGTTFQLIDDLLDYTSSEKEFGKPVGKDIREGKVTLPLIYTLSGMKEKDLMRFKKRFENGGADERDYEELINAVRNSESVEKVRSDARRYVDNAYGFLSKLPESSFREDLAALNDYFAGRSF